MKSRIIWGSLITITAILLVVGAVNRTMAHSETGSGERTRVSANTQNMAGSESATPTHSQDNGQGESQGQGNGEGQGNGAGQGQGNGQGQGSGEGHGNGEQQSAGSDNAVGANQGKGRGAGGGQGAEQSGEPEPLAPIDNLETVQGAVTASNEELLQLTTDNDEVMEIEGRGWRFALENGFVVGQNDTLTVVGFYDGDHFEPIAITNDASGQQILLRDASGRPMWAGQGRGQTGS